MRPIIRRRFAGWLLLSFLLATIPAAAQWDQWGGPERDFRVPATDLPRQISDPPRLLWTSELGEGESAVLVQGDVLYTMYRSGGQEVVVALKAADGERLWEHRYDAPIPDGMYVKHGDGPHATPVLAGGKICTFGIAGSLRCLDRKSGDLLWAHETLSEYGGKAPNCGYGGSPLVHQGLLITSVGGVGNAVMAFHLNDGSVAWKSQDDGAGYAAPMLIDVDGEAQLVMFLRSRITGLDPATGALKWSHPHETSHGVNASQPVWGADGILFLSSAYDQGSRGLRIQREQDTTTVQEIWSQKKMALHFTNAVRRGEHVYGTSGDFGPVFLTAMNVRTGEIAWQKRGVVSKATILHAGPRVLMVDEKGKLVLATLSPEGVEVHAEHPIVEGRVWAPPTLVGDRLYVRNRKNLHAFQLGA